MAPKTARGELRMQKPPLTNWAIAASYATLGTSALAERLPFLLAGLATVYLTYRIAKRFTGKQTTALLAAAILAAHPQFILSCCRGIPDALQTFFITLSLYGFLRLIVFNERTAGSFWMAYGGAALTFQSKGLFGIAVIAFALLYAGFRARDWRTAIKLIHIPGLAVFAFCSLGWFAYLFWRFGSHGFHIFYADQVTGNVRGHWWAPFLRFVIYIGILLLNFLPWSPTILEWLARKKFKVQGDTPAAAQQFILVWLGALFVFLALCENVSLRYLLPATPLLAVLLADWLESAAGTKLFFSLRRILVVLLVMLVLFVAVAIWVVSQWPATLCLLLMMGTVLITAGWLAWNTFVRPRIPAGEGMMFTVFLFCMIVFAAGIPVLLPDRATQMAAALQRTPDIDRQVLLIGNIQLGSRLRVMLGREWNVTQQDRLKPDSSKRFKTLLLPENQVATFAEQGWQIQDAAMAPGAPPRKELLAAIKSRQLPEVTARYGQRYFLASHP